MLQLYEGPELAGSRWCGHLRQIIAVDGLARIQNAGRYGLRHGIYCTYKLTDPI